MPTPFSAVRIFRPILAGATLRDRIIACVGALIGIGLTGLISGLMLGNDVHLPLIVAPMGASAVLLFAVPASPLAQPWPIIGGNVISSLVGAIVAHLVPEPALAAGLAVALAIAAMSLLRCIHPPGGAAALLTVFAGTPGHPVDFLFPLVPVALNTVLLVGLGWAFHKLTQRSYPHKAVAQPARPRTDADPFRRVGFRPEDIDSALANIGETFDISREDIERLVREVETRALVRSYPDLVCADIMSRNVVTIAPNSVPDAARALLLEHDVRVVPVVDDERRVLGTIGFRELIRPAGRVSDVMSEAITVGEKTLALELAPLFSRASARAVVVVDEQQRLAGLITQTDVLAALSSRLQMVIPKES